MKISDTLTINAFGQKDLNYEDKVFLTFDIDWASDQVLNFTVDLLEQYELGATFFVTHHTPVLDRIKANPKFELGIHPNFNFLLNGDFRYGKTYQEVVEYYFAMVPEAVSVRSHSLVQSTQILDTFQSLGLKFDVNLLLPRRSQMVLHPMEHWAKGMTRIPYFWEDDIHLIYGDAFEVELYLNSEGLKIFDFHPIHVFLNSENLSRYDSARPHLQDFEKLQAFVNTQQEGILDFFHRLAKAIRS